ncbi:MAG TPA: formate dehydrogenase subunit gamma [Steroidobacteraceae bacterium]|nr:formate dehydrogenase subunit gamma [Steroidobacteraceae bacterium]
MISQIHSIIERFRSEPGPLILVLHAIQAEFGYIPEEAKAVVADGLNLSRAEVHGVVSFYHFFRHSPPGRHVVQLCRAEACQSMHADKLATHAQHRLGIGFHETTADGEFSLEPVYCLGNCACSPAMMVDGQLYGRMSNERFDEVLAEQQLPHQRPGS